MFPPDPSLGTANLFGELAGLVGTVEDFIVKDGEVEGEPQSDGMRGLHFRLGNFKSVLVRLLRIFDNS